MQYGKSERRSSSGPTSTWKSCRSEQVLPFASAPASASVSRSMGVSSGLSAVRSMCTDRCVPVEPAQSCASFPRPAGASTESPTLAPPGAPMCSPPPSPQPPPATLLLLAF
eukprot:5621563-Pleurochrysis_carterae.AAC.1